MARYIYIHYPDSLAQVPQRRYHICEHSVDAYKYENGKSVRFAKSSYPLESNGASSFFPYENTAKKI